MTMNFIVVSVDGVILVHSPIVISVYHPTRDKLSPVDTRKAPAMKKKWLRNLTDISIDTTLAAIAYCLILMFIGYVLHKSTDWFYLYSLPIIVCAGTLNVISVVLNLCYRNPRQAMRVKLDEEEWERVLNTKLDEKHISQNLEAG